MANVLGKSLMAALDNIQEKVRFDGSRDLAIIHEMAHCVGTCVARCENSCYNGCGGNCQGGLVF